MLGVVAVQSPAAGYVTVYPCHEPVPTTSSFNIRPGGALAMTVLARTGPQGIGAVSSQVVHLVVDTSGAFFDWGGLDLVPVTPVRLLDTRSPGGAWRAAWRPRWS